MSSSSSSSSSSQWSGFLLECTVDQRPLRKQFHENVNCDYRSKISLSRNLKPVILNITFAILAFGLIFLGNIRATVGFINVHNV